MSQLDDLIALRELLLPLVDGLELDPAAAPVADGLLARIPVVGGRFIHPLTREPVAVIRVYGAGAQRVKILEPRFLRSLPPVSVAGLTQPAQFCGQVARALGEALGDLGRLRDALRAMGLTLDLEHDVLRLRGRATVAGVQVELVGLRPAGLVVAALAGSPLAGKVPREARQLALQGDPAADAAALGALVSALSARLRAGEPHPDEVEQLQPLSLDELEYAPEVKPHLAAAVADLGGPAADLSEAAAAPAPVSEVVELTDLVEEPAPVSAPVPAVPVPAPVPPLAPPAPAQGGAGASRPAGDSTAASLGALEIQKLVDLFGGATQVSAFGGKLRLVVPLKVVQGEFTFYLEQVAARAFRGFLVSPQGHRYPVEVDLAKVYDLKEVFDRVMMGR